MITLPPTLHHLIEKNARALSSPGIFIPLLFLYLLLLMGLRLALFPGASDDDAEQLFYAQTLAWGYKWNQPPLYTWLVIGAEKILGVGLLAVAAVKYSAIFVLYLFVWLTAKLLTRDNLWATVATLSTMAIYYIGWDIVLNYSNTVLLGALISITIYCLLKLGHHDRIALYPALGLVIGFGFLTKYNYGVFLFPFLVGCLTDKNIRARLVSRKGLIIPALAIAITLPHLVWLITDNGGFLHNKHLVPGKAAQGYNLKTTGKGLLDGILGSLAFLCPMLVLILFFFPKKLITGIFPAQSKPAAFRIFEIYFICFFILMMAIVVLGQVDDVKNHWLMPLFPLPLYLVLRLQLSQPESKKISGYIATMSALAVIVVVGLAGRGVITPIRCDKCSMAIHYDDLAYALKKTGFKAGTIITYDYPTILTGNLRRYLSNAQFVSERFKNFNPTVNRLPGQCLAVWSMEGPHAHEYRWAVMNFIQKRFDAFPGKNLSPKDSVANLAVGKTETATGFGGLLGGKPYHFEFYLLPKDEQGHCF